MDRYIETKQQQQQQQQYPCEVMGEKKKRKKERKKVFGNFLFWGALSSVFNFLKFQF